MWKYIAAFFTTRRIYPSGSRKENKKLRLTATMGDGGKITIFYYLIDSTKSRWFVGRIEALHWDVRDWGEREYGENIEKHTQQRWSTEWKWNFPSYLIRWVILMKILHLVDYKYSNHWLALARVASCSSFTRKCCETANNCWGYWESCTISFYALFRTLIAKRKAGIARARN